MWVLTVIECMYQWVGVGVFLLLKKRKWLLWTVWQFRSVILSNSHRSVLLFLLVSSSLFGCLLSVAWRWVSWMSFSISFFWWYSRDFWWFVQTCSFKMCLEGRGKNLKMSKQCHSQGVIASLGCSPCGSLAECSMSRTNPWQSHRHDSTVCHVCPSQVLRRVIWDSVAQTFYGAHWPIPHLSKVCVHYSKCIPAAHDDWNLVY